MRKILALLAFLLIPSSLLFAQDGNDKMNNNATPPPIVKPARDFLMLQLTYNNWVKKPDSITTKSFNYGFNGYFCYDFPIKKTKLSFATGIGINVSVEYLNNLVISDTALVVSQARFLPDIGTIKHYTRYKFVTTYISAPFELRYYGNTLNRNKGFKAAIGMEIGTLLGAHTKGVYSIGGTNFKDKVDTKRFVTPWNFAATARVGWGNFSLFASYNLTNVFKDNAGPPITPASVGICLTGL
jgi:opacity protein-like surface antigen